MQDKVFLDTNFLVHLANEDSPFNLEFIKLLGELKEGYELWISRQVLREYAVIMSRSGFIEKPVDSGSLVSDLMKWESIFSVADETEEVTINLLKLISTYTICGKRIHDANIVATMITNSITNLLTLNREDFKNFKEINLMRLTV